MLELTSEQVEQAIVFATARHKGQTRKGDGRPYILHPITVLIRLSEVKTSKNIFLLFVASLLHDVVEDCGVRLTEIARRFGHHVAALVEELTTDEIECKRLGKKDYLAKKMVGMSSYALVIKLCDRLDNVSDLKTMGEESRRKKIEETEYILNALGERKLTGTHKKLITAIREKLNG